MKKNLLIALTFLFISSFTLFSQEKNNTPNGNWCLDTGFSSYFLEINDSTLKYIKASDEESWVTFNIYYMDAENNKYIQISTIKEVSPKVREKYGNSISISFFDEKFQTSLSGDPFKYSRISNDKMVIYLDSKGTKLQTRESKEANINTAEAIGSGFLALAGTFLAGKELIYDKATANISSDTLDKAWNETVDYLNNKNKASGWY